MFPSKYSFADDVPHIPRAVHQLQSTALFAQSKAGLRPVHWSGRKGRLPFRKNRPPRPHCPPASSQGWTGFGHFLKGASMSMPYLAAGPASFILPEKESVRILHILLGLSNLTPDLFLQAFEKCSHGAFRAVDLPLNMGGHFRGHLMLYLLDQRQEAGLLQAPGRRAAHFRLQIMRFVNDHNFNGFVDESAQPPALP